MDLTKKKLDFFARDLLNNFRLSTRQCRIAESRPSTMDAIQQAGCLPNRRKKKKEDDAKGAAKDATKKRAQDRTSSYDSGMVDSVEIEDSSAPPESPNVDAIEQPTPIRLAVDGKPGDDNPAIGRKREPTVAFVDDSGDTHELLEARTSHNPLTSRAPTSMSTLTVIDPDAEALQWEAKRKRSKSSVATISQPDVQVIRSQKAYPQVEPSAPQSSKALIVETSAPDRFATEGLHRLSRERLEALEPEQGRMAVGQILPAGVALHTLRRDHMPERRRLTGDDWLDSKGSLVTARLAPTIGNGAEEDDRARTDASAFSPGGGESAAKRRRREDDDGGTSDWSAADRAGDRPSQALTGCR